MENVCIKDIETIEDFSKCIDYLVLKLGYGIANFSLKAKTAYGTYTEPDNEYILNKSTYCNLASGHTGLMLFTDNDVIYWHHRGMYDYNDIINTHRNIDAYEALGVQSYWDD